MNYCDYEYKGETIDIDFEVQESCGVWGDDYIVNIAYAVHENGEDFTEEELVALTASDSEMIFKMALDGDPDLLVDHPFASDQAWYAWKEG